MKLSGLQVFWLMFTFEAGNMVLLTIGPVLEEAHQDVWISYLIANILGVLIVYFLTKTALLYPKHTLIQYSKIILGSFFGTVVILNYLVQWYSVIGNILRQYADMTITLLLPKTPTWILFVTILLLLIYVTYIGGIEGIGRCAEVFGPIILFSLIPLIILSIKDFQVQNFLPIFFDTGVKSIWKGALPPLAFFGESAMILMLVSFMEKPEKAIKSAVFGLLSAGILVTLIAISVLLTFGSEISGKLRHPSFDLISYISVMDFIQNLEIIAIVVWILSVFIKLSVYFFLVCYGTAQLFKLKDWRKMIWIAAIFFFALAQFYPSTSYTFGYMKSYWIYYTIPINAVGIPLLLRIIATIRKRKSPTIVG